MKPKHHRQKARPALDLIEEAIHLLRTAPARVLVGYYVGTLPFVLGGLYFWADMSRSPTAPERVVEAALGVTLLFVWMKSWQAVFAGRLRAFASGSAMPPLKLGGVLRLAGRQAALQPAGLFLLPLAALLALPFIWVYAFFQNLTALGGSESPAAAGLLRRSLRHASLWPEQNLFLLLCLAAFSGFVFLNCCIGCALLPQLLKTLLGVETVFTRGGWALLNTTFFAAMFCLTYLCVDPIAKAVYVLRCFYGDSIQSGADLRAELRQSQSANATRIATGLATLLMFGAVLETHSAETTKPARPEAVGIAPEKLDQAIEQTIQQRKFTWRMPREGVVKPRTEKPPGVLAEFFQRVGRMLADILKRFFDWLAWLLNKIFGNRSFSWKPAGADLNWPLLLKILLCVLLAILTAVVTLSFYRLWQRRQPRPGALEAEALQPVPDLRDENVGADQLPEDGWTQLAREFLAKGEFRLALRAFYLASLAHLATRNLISLARFKSNRDYERELDRRAHSLPQLRQLFGENGLAFDRIWYGTHQATADGVAAFATRVEQIKDGA